ncbi:MAG: DUF6282 family protein [Gaiellaceae bacterium]
MFDLHVHSAPCVLPRRADDRDTVAAYERAGFSGCVLKGHYEPTAGRATAAGSGRRPDVYGAIVLNAPAGGLNPAAVAASLELGARVVWMPTLDARAHRTRGLPLPAAASAGAGLAIPPAEPAAEPLARQIVELVAEADAVLATGHLGVDEVGWLVRCALGAGVRRVLLTHPAFTVPDMSTAEIEELCGLGAVAEITAFQVLRGADPVRLAELAGRLGAERCVLSSDAGQPDSPEAPEALAFLVERLVACGLDSGAARAMASESPERLVAP